MFIILLAIGYYYCNHHKPSLLLESVTHLGSDETQHICQPRDVHQSPEAKICLGDLASVHRRHGRKDESMGDHLWF